MSEKNTVNIGLKLADGTFYPVFDENFRGTKRIVLTTVHDNQSSVQIDIYKGLAKEVFEDAYIGTLVIENIKPDKKGSAEIELVIGIDADGNLNANAKDKESGEQQALSVSLASLARRSDYEIPEFDIEKAPVTIVDEEPAEIIDTPPAAVTETAGRPAEAPAKRKSPALAVILIVLGLLLISAVAAVIIWFFFPAIPQRLGITSLFPAASSAPASPTPEETPTVNEVRTPSPSEEAASPSPAAEPSPSPASGKGEWYKVVWGDTLWDLSRRYYRDPFQYMKIADAPENNIPNPDLIFENQRIFIPDK